MSTHLLLARFPSVRFIIFIETEVFVMLGKLGANAILGVSLAVCKAGAAKKVSKYAIILF